MYRQPNLHALTERPSPAGRQALLNALHSAASHCAGPVRIACLALATAGLAYVPARSDDVPATAQEVIDNALDSALQNNNANGNGRGNSQLCLIIVTDDGTIYNMPGTNRLTSSGAGGRPGRATVYASQNSFRLSIDPPLGFRLAPQNGNDNVVFHTRFSGTGATSFSSRPGTSDQKLREGTTQVEVDLEADRGNDTFPAGTYQAELTLRCE